MTLNSPATTSDAANVGSDSPKVAIAHDWLVRYAGSERCVDELLLAFPGSEVLTTLVRPSHLPEQLRGARPSMLQRIPGAASHHEWLLPLMPLAWRLMPGPVGVDAVVSSSHACAKAVRVEPGTPHLCYCHTPMRYAWDFDAEQERFPRGSRTVARGLMAGFRRWDRATAERRHPLHGQLARGRRSHPALLRAEAQVCRPRCAPTSSRRARSARTASSTSAA